MSEFVWNDTDILTFLGVVPSVDEYATYYEYSVRRCGLRLDLAIEPYSGDIRLAVFQDGTAAPVLDLMLLECCGIRYIHDQRGEYLEFAPARAFGSRYDGTSPLPFGVRLYVDPCLSITLF